VQWEGRGPVASRARVEYRFKPNGDGTDFFYLNEYDLPGGALGRFAGKAVARVTQKELEGSLQRLKSLVE
jgi:polyketide cyclase/dehydrase/lipid transport protein